MYYTRSVIMVLLPGRYGVLSRIQGDARRTPRLGIVSEVVRTH